MITCLVIHILLLALSLLVYSSIKRMVVWFNLGWTILIAISVMGINGINHAPDLIYQYFCIGSLTFNLFSYIFDFVIFKNNRQIKRIIDYKNYCYITYNNTQKKVLIFLSSLTLFYYIIKSFVLVKGLFGGSTAYSLIRYHYYSNENFTNQFEYILVMYFIDPLVILFSILYVINFFTKNLGTLCGRLMLANVGLRTFISGGRMFLFELAIMLVFAFFLFNTGKKERKNRKKNRKKTLSLIILGMILAYFAVKISLERGRSGTFLYVIYEMIGMNFTGSFTFFNVLLEKNLFLERTFGQSMLAGFIDPVITFLRFLGFTEYEAFEVSEGRIISVFQEIGSRFSYNAMPTMYYFFFTDFQRLGLLLGPAFLSYITSVAEKKMARRKRFALVYFFLVFLIVSESSMNWLLFKSSFALVFVYVYLLSVIGAKNEKHFCDYT